MADPPKTARCRRCAKRRHLRARGLCPPCYALPDSAALFPSVSVLARRSLGPPEHSSKPASAPTATRPGSLARMKVYRARLEAGESLFHPDDDNSNPHPECPFALDHELNSWSPGKPTGLE